MALNRNETEIKRYRSLFDNVKVKTDVEITPKNVAKRRDESSISRGSHYQDVIFKDDLAVYFVACLDRNDRRK